MRKPYILKIIDYNNTEKSYINIGIFFANIEDVENEAKKAFEKYHRLASEIMHQNAVKSDEYCTTNIFKAKDHYIYEPVLDLDNINY